MSRSTLTPAAIKYIKANRLNESSVSMANTLGLGKSIVLKFLQKNGLSVPREVANRFRTEALVGRTNFTEEEDQIIREHYLRLPVKTLAAKLNRSHTGVNVALKRLGLVIPRELIEKRKAQSRIQPGAVPPNKGKTQSEYMSQDAIDRTVKSRFKTGSIPKNSYNEIGKITARKDSKTDRFYKYICIKLGVWVLYHKYLWEQTNGKVPGGSVLRFIDGDSLNVTLDNLMLITRKEHRLMNHPATLLPDKYVARCLVGKNGDPSLVEDQPMLLELKRNQLQLNKLIKNEQATSRR